MLIGGENHKTGQGPDTMLHYLALEAFAEKTLGIEEYVVSLECPGFDYAR